MLKELREAMVSSDSNNSAAYQFGETNESELISFCAYAIAFPRFVFSFNRYVRHVEIGDA